MAKSLFKVHEGLSIHGTRAGGNDNTNTVNVIKANVDPTITAVSAVTGSLLLRTDSAAAYIKNDDGSTTNWSLLSSSAEDGYQNTYIGKTAGGAGNVNPSYSSTNVVSGNLTTAIGALDTEIGAGVATPESRTNNPISDQAINLNIEALDSAIGGNVTSTNYASTSTTVNANISALDTQVKTNTDAIAAAAGGLSWRTAVLALTADDDLQIASENVTLSTLLPFSDDAAPAMVIGDFSAGDQLLSKNASGTDKLWEVWDDGGTLKLRTSGFNVLAQGDTFIVYNDLTDDAGQENTSIWNYDGTELIKVGDFDWQLATGIDLSTGYTASAGTVASGDSIEVAIQKVDGNIAQVITALGNPNATNMGTYTGTTITDNQSAKQNIQQLETSGENLQTSVGNSNSTNMGTYTGTIITDDQSAKQNIQELETATENVSTALGNPNSTNMGTYTGGTISDNETAKQNIQELETAYETQVALNAELLTTDSVLTVSNKDVDSVSVAAENVMAIEWTIGCNDAVATGRYLARVIGLVSADATAVDYNEYSILEVGTAPNITISVTVSGGAMKLNVANASANTVNVSVKRKILRTA